MASIRKIIDFGIETYNNIFDKILIQHRRQTEIKKFKDKRRISITNSVNLTPEQKKSIDKFYQENYGSKIPYTWHRHFTAYTGRFDVRYFPELLWIPEFEHFMNPYHDYESVFADKNILPVIASNVGVKTPVFYFSSIKGLFRNSKYETITMEHAIEMIDGVGDVFIKPSVDSGSGKGCILAKINNKIDAYSGKKIKDILKECGNDFVVQQRLKCCKEIANIYPNSVNTFRVITYRWNDSIEYCPIIMRIGSNGNYLDNAHAGGMFIAVEDDGQLHDKAFTEFKKEYSEHPDTKIEFSKVKIPDFHKVIETAKIMHTQMPQLGLVNWDFTIDENYFPVLIEANVFGGSIWMAEMAHGKGPFGDKTNEILKWIGFCKRLSVSERKKYLWGNIKG